MSLIPVLVATLVLGDCAGGIVYVTIPNQSQGSTSTTSGLVTSGYTVTTGTLPPATPIALRSMDYRASNVELFRSSTFYVPRNELGYQYWLGDFPDKSHISRITDLEQSIYTSSDISGVTNYLNGRKPYIDIVVLKSSNLLLYTGKMPSWLSK